MDTSNGIFQHNLLSDQTLHADVSMIDPSIDNRIETIGGYSHTLSTPATKEGVVDTTRGSARVNQILRQVSRTVRDSCTPGDTGMYVRSKPAPSPVLIRSPTMFPVCFLIGSLQVGKKWQSTSPYEVRNTQKLDTAVDRKLPDDWDSVFFFNKVIGREISHGSSDNL